MPRADAALLVRWNMGAGVRSIAISSDGSRVASGSRDGTVYICDAQTGAIMTGPLRGPSDWASSVAFSPDNNHVVTGFDNGIILLWERHSGALVPSHSQKHEGSVWSVAFSPDGTCIASGSSDRTIHLSDTRSGCLTTKVLQGHAGVVYSVAFSSDGTRLISGSGDRLIRIWDLHTGTASGKPLEGHISSVTSVIFFNDSSRVVSGSLDGAVYVWDVQGSSQIVTKLQEHGESVYSVAISPNQIHVASGSLDGTIRVWDIRTGLSIATFEGHTDSVYSVSFSPDGSRIISGSDDCSICVWEAPKELPLFNTVSSGMSAQEMFNCLVQHGCTDLSSLINPNGYSSSAIATGGFGDVWQGQMKNGILVAVKCLRLHMILEGDKKGMKRAMRELHHWSKARHENVQELIGIIMFQGRLGMVSRWMENGNLQQYIQKHPSVDRYQLCVQLATGVSYLHRIGMVHGDLKALNVLVSHNGVVKINDFDYSILSDSTLRFSETTQAGGGTLRWMAPELLLRLEDDRSPPIMRNAKTDVYALGMTMLEIITGKVPYQEFQYEFGIYRALDQKQFPKRPEELPQSNGTDQVWELLLKCWDHNPSVRPDASSVLESLQKLLYN